jgi:hypothetical protein
MALDLYEAGHLMPQNLTLDLYRGDSRHWRFHLYTNVDETIPYDLTGVTAKAEIRLKSGTPVLASMPCVVTLPNIIDMDLTAEVSETLTMATAQWDLQLTWPAGQVTTILAGAVRMTADITDSVAAMQQRFAARRLSAG